MVSSNRAGTASAGLWGIDAAYRPRFAAPGAGAQGRWSLDHDRAGPLGAGIPSGVAQLVGVAKGIRWVA